MIDISISTLFYGKPEVSQKFLAMLKNTLQGRDDVEVIIRNNGMVDGDKSTQLVLNSGLKNIQYIPSGINVGFSRGHNLNLEYARGQFFIVLNNDLFFGDSKWVEKLLAALREGSDPMLKLVGLQGAPSHLVLLPNGHISGRTSPSLDYIEGSCIAGLTEDFKQYGLFDEIYEMGFFEDGDLSMRFRQMGFKISTVNISHQHMRSQSLSLIPQAERDRFISRNCETFKKRWPKYLMNRAFTNCIEVKMESLGIGDILCMTPVLEALRQLYPTAEIEVTTSYPDVFQNNPYLTRLYELKRTYTQVYDRQIDLKPHYWNYRLIGQDCEDIAAVKVDSYKPQLFLSAAELDEGVQIVDSIKEDKDQIVIGVALRNSRPTWQGKCYPLENTRELIQLLQQAGGKVIELGKGTESSGVADLDLIDKTDLRQFFSVIAAVDYLVTIDSLALHVAQWCGTPTFCLFGATAHQSYICDYTSVYPIWKEGLQCVGCYQRNNKNVFNQCAIGSQECMDIDPRMVLELVLMNKENLYLRNIEILQDLMRKEHK